MSNAEKMNLFPALRIDCTETTVNNLCWNVLLLLDREVITQEIKNILYLSQALHLQWGRVISSELYEHSLPPLKRRAISVPKAYGKII